MDRATRYTPAVTIVAAWMSADTGVGPSMASGSQEWSGSWADFPVAPRKNARAMTVSVRGSVAWTSPTFSNTSWKATEPKVRKVRIMPTVKPQSPMRFMTKAFFAATYGSGRSNQKPMSR